MKVGREGSLGRFECTAMDEPKGQGGYEAFEHTADVGLRVWGGSLSELFEQAAAGFISVLVDPNSAHPGRIVNVKITGGSPEELLVGWLQEILFAFDAEGFVPKEVRVVSVGENEVTGQLLGEDLDLSRHRLRQAVKAVTYSDLAIRESDGRYEVRIVFDV